MATKKKPPVAKPEKPKSNLQELMLAETAARSLLLRKRDNKPGFPYYFFFPLTKLRKGRETEAWEAFAETWRKKGLTVESYPSGGGPSSFFIYVSMYSWVIDLLRKAFQKVALKRVFSGFELREDLIESAVLLRLLAGVGPSEVNKAVKGIK